MNISIPGLFGHTTFKLSKGLIDSNVPWSDLIHFTFIFGTDFEPTTWNFGSYRIISGRFLLWLFINASILNLAKAINGPPEVSSDVGYQPDAFFAIFKVFPFSGDIYDGEFYCFDSNALW